MLARKRILAGCQHIALPQLSARHIGKLLHVTMGRVSFQYRHPLRVIPNAAAEAVARKLPGNVFSCQVSPRASGSAPLQLVGSKIGNVRPQTFDARCTLRDWLLSQSNANP